MFAAQVHLALNHAPLFAVIVGTAFLAVAVFRKNAMWRRLAFGFLLAAALVAIPVYLTGESAEAVVEQDTSVAHGLIHRHEDAAWWAFVLMEILGTLSLVQLALPRWGRTPPSWVVAVTLLLGLVVSGVVIRTAHLGGQIHHSYLRTDSGQAIQDVGIDPRTDSHEPVDQD